jgi:hypothetical protein
MSNLILGTCANYTADQLSPFFLSLKAAGYKGKTVMFVNNVPDETIDFLRRHDCDVVAFSHIRHFKGAGRLQQLYALIMRCVFSSNPPRAFRVLAAKWWQFASSRYFMYESYIRQAGDELDKIMLTDVRDVLFQRDPFDFHPCDGLCAFQESVPRLGDNFHNSKWIKESYGRNALDEMQNNPVYCSGVTIGPAADVLSYLEIMNRHLISRYASAGYDQGVHNYLIHKGIIKNVTVYQNWSGPVLTVGAMKPDDVPVSSDGLLKNKDGQPVNVVHQYDRHPAIAVKLLTRLGIDPKRAFPQMQ